MPWGAVAGAAVGLIGSSMQADATEDAAAQAGKIDPRMDKWVYGLDDGSTKGLLGNLSDWYASNQSGMNDQMRQGLNTQWGVLNNPNTMSGYDQTARLGSGLMGAPVMGNPFSDGRMSLMQPGGLMSGQPSLGGGGSPSQSRFPSYQPIAAPPSPGGLQGPFTAPPPAPVAPPPPPAPSPYSALPPGQLSNEYQGGWRLMADPSTGQPFWADKDGRNVGFYDGGNTGNGGA